LTSSSFKGKLSELLYIKLNMISRYQTKRRMSNEVI
jgi:hypothetical protein